MLTPRSNRPGTRLLALTLAALATLALNGCAGVPVPTEQMAVAQASVLRADTATTIESAAPELQLATGKLAGAHQALDAKDYDRARRLAEQADVDAQAAEQHAQSVRARLAARESQDSARALREEIGRKAPL